LFAMALLVTNFRLARDGRSALTRFLPPHRVRRGLEIAPWLFTVAAVLHSFTAGERFGVVLLVFALSIGIVLVAIAVAADRRFAGRRVLSGLVAAVLAVSVAVSVAWTNWPLKAAYAASRAALDGFARRVRVGERVDLPARVGLFRVHDSSVRRDVVCLWTHNDSALVQAEPQTVPLAAWSWIHLDERWQFVTED